jgi:hypothetical protein
MKLEFLDRFLEFPQISNLIKFRLIGAEFFYADRRTDVKKLIFDFCNFANAIKRRNITLLEGHYQDLLYHIYWSSISGANQTGK